MPLAMANPDLVDPNTSETPGWAVFLYLILIIGTLLYYFLSPTKPELACYPQRDSGGEWVECD